MTGSEAPLCVDPAATGIPEVVARELEAVPLGLDLRKATPNIGFPRFDVLLDKALANSAPVRLPDFLTMRRAHGSLKTSTR